MTALNLIEQLLIVLLTDGTADNLADTREEDVGTLHGLAVGVLLHIERLDLSRIVGHDDRALEVMLHQVALVLTGEIHTPFGDGELELMTFLGSLLQDIEALSIRQTYEVLLHHALQGLDERLVNHLVEELEVVLAVIQCPLHAVLDEVLLEVHQFVLVHEGHLRLNHPELGQMARRIAVLGTEGGTEGVDSA